MRMDGEPTRVMVYGVTGSGKTTLARALAERAGLPFYDVDELTWNPGWQAKSAEEQRAIFAEICARDAWLLDTAYGIWLDIPLARMQRIVALDYPRWVSLGRLVRRTVARAVDKRPVCNGNTESWRLVFSRQSILAWHFRSFRRKRERIREFATLPGVALVVLRSPREADAWLAGQSATVRD